MKSDNCELYNPKETHDIMSKTSNLKYVCDNFYEIEHPKGYTQGRIESWDYIIDKKMNFCEGNIIKYVTRHRTKGGKKDLLKARQYLNKLIETEYDDGT